MPSNDSATCLDCFSFPCTRHLALSTRHRDCHRKGWRKVPLRAADLSPMLSVKWAIVAPSPQPRLSFPADLFSQTRIEEVFSSSQSLESPDPLKIIEEWLRGSSGPLTLGFSGVFLLGTLLERLVLLNYSRLWPSFFSLHSLSAFLLEK